MIKAILDIRPIAETDVVLLEKQFPQGGVAKHAERLSRQQKGDATYLIAWHKGYPVGHALLNWGGSRDEHVAKQLKSACPDLRPIRADRIPFARHRQATHRFRRAACIHARLLIPWIECCRRNQRCSPPPIQTPRLPRCAFWRVRRAGRICRLARAASCLGRDLYLSDKGSAASRHIGEVSERRRCARAATKAESLGRNNVASNRNFQKNGVSR